MTNRVPRPNLEEVELVINPLVFIQWIWSHKIKFLCSLILALFLGGLIYLAIPQYYQSSAVIVPTKLSNSTNSRLEELSQNYGRLAGLAGISLPQSNTDHKINLAIQILQSRQFLSQFARDQQLLPLLFAYHKSSWFSSQWNLNADLYDNKTNQWQLERPLSDKQIADKINTYLSIDPLPKNKSFYQISFEFWDPVQAQEILTSLIASLNLTIKNQEVTQATKLIEYIDLKLATTDVQDLRNSFFELKEDLLRTLMLADTEEEYLFTTIDPAYVPQSPMITPWFAFVGISGLGVIILWLMIFMIQQGRRPD